MLIIVFAYLLGSIPAAYLVTRLVTGADIRHLGDGNMGAKNTFHSVGWLPAVLVAVVDVGKGALAVATARYFNASEGLVMLAGACAVLGPRLSRIPGIPRRARHGNHDRGFWPALPATDNTGTARFAGSPGNHPELGYKLCAELCATGTDDMAGRPTSKAAALSGFVTAYNWTEEAVAAVAGAAAGSLAPGNRI